MSESDHPPCGKSLIHPLKKQKWDFLILAASSYLVRLGKNCSLNSEEWEDKPVGIKEERADSGLGCLRRSRNLISKYWLENMLPATVVNYVDETMPERMERRKLNPFYTNGHKTPYFVTHPWGDLMH